MSERTSTSPYGRARKVLQTSPLAAALIAVALLLPARFEAASGPAPHLAPPDARTASAVAGGEGPAGPAQQPAAPAAAGIPSPEEFFGFRMGADGRLARWESIERYFTLVADASDRVDLLEVGRTTEGQRLIAALVTSPRNLARLDAIQATNRRLADPRTLAEAEARQLLADQPAIVAIGASIHATEIGASQAASEFLHHLATAGDEETRQALESLVILLVPSLNPDGHRLVVDWFERHRNTPFEASPMPWLYHRYAGHDINRDAFMLNLAENRSLADFFYRRWHPQVFLTMHQMGPRGPRFFVPPNYDPIDPNYDPLLWRMAGLLGHAMALELERDNRRGVVQNALFDYYWPGYEDSAPLGHNTVCLLTEAASARLALPIEIKPGDLTGSPRGLPDHRPQINFPNPWPGGTWRLRDIVEYDLTALRGLLRGATRYRREIVENFYAMGRRAVERGREGGPFAFAIPPDQHDPHAAAALVNVLVGGAVEVHEAIEPFRAGTRDYPAGTSLVLMAQPFRAYAKTLLERQEYPVRRLLPTAPPERPYDVAGWTLPYQMGVVVDTIEQPFELPALSRVERAVPPPAKVTGDRRPSYYLVDARGNAGALAINRLAAAGFSVSFTTAALEAGGRRFEPGSLVVSPASRARQAVERIASTLGLPAVGLRGRPPAATAPVGHPRIALYKPWVENIDEGWTRWLLEQYEFRYVSLDDARVRAGNLRAAYDVIVLPDAPPERLVAGHAAGTLPSEYTGGLGEAGVAALKTFVEAGGTLVCLDSSCGLAVQALGLAVKDVAQDPAAGGRFFCPGSILRLTLDVTHPLAYGMRPETAAFFAYSSAYEVAPAQPTGAGHGGTPSADHAIAVVGRYGEGNPLLSGWLEGPEVVAGRGAVLEARVGRGRLVVLGFRAQHRAQAHATFRLLFNAIYSHR